MRDTPRTLKGARHDFNGLFPARNSRAAGTGERARRKDLTIECGELYRSVSKQPVSNRGMIFCCNAMRAEMTIPDEVIFDSAKDTLLKVKYRLPRKSPRPPFVRAPE
jgi:hypothetical protein